MTIQLGTLMAKQTRSALLWCPEPLSLAITVNDFLSAVRPCNWHKAFSMSYMTLPCLGLLIGLALPATAAAISARLDAESIRLGETVRLVLETDAQPEASPDLTHLQRDFQIVGRSSSRQISEVNGQRQERHELRLILSPRRGGLLVIPPIPFGETSTQALSLTVGTGSVQLPQKAAFSPPVSLVTPLTPVTPVGPSAPGPWATPPPMDGTPLKITSTAQTPASSQVPGVGPGTPTPPPTPNTSPPPVPNTVGQSPTGEQTGVNNPLPSLWSRLLTHWPVTTIGLFLLILIGWGWRWHLFSRFRWKASGMATKVTTGVPKNPENQPEPVNIQPLGAVSPASAPVKAKALNGDRYAQDQGWSLRHPAAAAITAVRLAYENTDAAAARDALLTWATLVFPDRTPGNLALLARRCQEPLRSDILLLEQTFFSPQPLDWNMHRVWEQLLNFDPLPPEEPASFRQKRPLRRRPMAPA